MKIVLVAGRLLTLWLLFLQPRWSSAGSSGWLAPPRGRALSSFDTEVVADTAGKKHPKPLGESPDSSVVGGGEEKETIAQILDEALKQEFSEEEVKKVADEGKIYNETAKAGEAKPETVLIISSQKKPSNHSTEAEHGSSTAATGSAAGNSSSDKEAEQQPSKIELAVESDVDRIIDSHDNVYVLSKPNEEGSMGLNLDPQFVRDLTILIAASAAAGCLMEALGQPTINGYFIAGSIVGPGGLKLVNELVQVQSIAQLGVQLLLFSLGLEFSLAKLKAMRNVAILGGLLQIVLMSGLASVGAAFIGASAYQGAFLGALVSMSSTSIVVKCLNDARVQNQPAGQITIATLVLQDCVVGLLFALMPVLSSAADGDKVSVRTLATVLGRLAVVLIATVGTAVLLARTLLPRLVRALARHSSAETYQMAAIAFCLVTALATTRLGVSPELGAFIAGVMVGSTDQQESMLHHLEPITHFFVALFIASIGLLLSPVFLLHHLSVLAAGVSVVVIGKTALFGGVVWLFRYPADVALSVGINLAQIGEFGFVLLSVAHQYGLVPSQVYMLLMGVTALSLLLTPFLLQATVRIVPKPGTPNMELTSLKRHPSSMSSDGLGSPPNSPLTGVTLDSGDVVLKVQQQGHPGAELGHREDVRFSHVEGSGAGRFPQGTPFNRGSTAAASSGGGAGNRDTNPRRPPGNRG
ncbi:hypothetical protein N2152v2_004028 [Parachlorella kessleri]